MIVRKFLFFLFLLTSTCLLVAQGIDRKTLLQDIQYLASDELAGRKPLTEGNLQAAEYIKKRFTQLGLTSQYKNYTQSFELYADRGEGEIVGKGSNIVGFIPGQESEKLIVITAHYDHLGETVEGIYNGADDNASGTAALMALAAYFSEHKPDVSLVIAALDAEEMGLQGARALVRDFPFPLENVLLNVNMDMVSRNENYELYAAGTLHNPWLKPILERASRGAKVSLRFGHDVPGTGSDDWTNASDHAAFHEKEIPFVYFGVEDHDDYHTTSDTFENIDQDFYYDAVDLILRCMKELDKSFSR